MPENVVNIILSRQICLSINGSRGAKRRGNAELPGFAGRSFGPFGALRLGNQPFDRQNLRNNQQLRCRYRGEPACQLRIGENIKKDIQ